MGLINAKTVIGMDIGKKYSWCEAISTETGEVFKEEKLIKRKEEFISFLDSLPRLIRLVMEASGNSAYLCECWEDLVEEIQIAYPLRAKAIASAKIKTGRIDDGILAHLGMADLVPQSYFPPREVRDLREILSIGLFWWLFKPGLRIGFILIFGSWELRWSRLIFLGNRVLSGLGSLSSESLTGVFWSRILGYWRFFRVRSNLQLMLLNVLPKRTQQ